MTQTPINVAKALDDVERFGVDIETKFLSEAEAGHFRYLEDYEGTGPIAWGAANTGNLFSMAVTESPDYPAGSVYRIDYERL